MRQSTVRLAVTAAAMLTDEQKAALARGETQRVKLTSKARMPFTLDVSFAEGVATISFGPKPE